MEFCELIEARRSIRSYESGVTVSTEDIIEMIYAAQQAPSWKNSQTGRYYVAITPCVVDKIRLECLPDFNSQRTQNAAAFIICAFKKGFSGFYADGTPTDNNENAWGAYDLGLQNQNLLLKAMDLGYDTLIMGLRDVEKLRELFDIPKDEEVLSVIAVGKKTASVKKPTRNDPKEIVRFL